MNILKIISIDDIYHFVEQLMFECRRNDELTLLRQLDDALHLGSSSIEILGAIRKIFIENRAVIIKLMGNTNDKEIDKIIAFVDKAYGQ